jgi:hypothetical protein
VKAIDLFAGPGGWDYACRILGFDPLGIEWDDAAVATRAAVGLRTLQADVSALDPLDVGYDEGGAYDRRCVDLLIASPPCPSFSAAGKGLGIEDLPLMYPAPPIPDHVLAAVRWEWYKPEPPKRRLDILAGKFFTPTDPLTPAERQHVEQGGLLLRELTDAGHELLGTTNAQ